MTDVDSTAGKVGEPPEHYRGNGIQVFDVVDAYELDFYSGHVLRYLVRADKKGSRANDLAKALHYCQEIEARFYNDHVWKAVDLPNFSTPEDVAEKFGLRGCVWCAVVELLYWRFNAAPAYISLCKEFIYSAFTENPVREDAS